MHQFLCSQTTEELDLTTAVDQREHIDAIEVLHRYTAACQDIEHQSLPPSQERKEN